MTKLIPFKWIGSKIGMLPHLLPLFPPHHTYVDVFGGSGAILLNKAPAVVEVYNDLDSGLVTFFEVIRNPETFQRFYEMAQWMVSSRELHDKFKATWTEPDDPVERAIRWWYVACTSFGGKWGKGWAVLGSGSNKSEIQRFQKLISRLQALHQRFQNVQIEHLDFRDLIPMYDSPETLFYCDPPYTMDTRASQGGVYQHESDPELHHDLVDLLLGMQGMAILSGYETPIYQPLIDAGWDTIRIRRPIFSKGRTRAGKLKGEGALQGEGRIEVIYRNPKTQKYGQGILL